MRSGLYPSLFGGWTPLRLIPSGELLAWWDAERTDRITQSSGDVSSWRDVVGGYDAVQATGANQPDWSGTSFNSRPGITPDGTDDQLTRGGTTGLPTGTTPFECWAAFDQTLAATDTDTRTIVSWGGTTASDQFTLRRVVSGGVNRAGILVPNGGSNTTATNSTVDFSGRHVLRAVCDGVNARIDVDGVAGTPVAAALGLGTTRLRFFLSTSAAQPGAGVLSTLLITSLLDATQGSQMLAYLNRRI